MAYSEQKMGFSASNIKTLLFARKTEAVNVCRVAFQEKESVFLLDDKRISEINMVSGRTKKRTPKLQPLLSGVVTMTSSHNGKV